MGEKIIPYPDDDGIDTEPGIPYLQIDDALHRVKLHPLCDVKHVAPPVIVFEAEGFAATVLPRDDETFQLPPNPQIGEVVFLQPPT